MLSGRFRSEALLGDEQPDAVLQIQQLHALKSHTAGTVWGGSCLWLGSKIPVVTKRFDLEAFDELATELEAYSRLSSLVPALAYCLAAIASRSLDWIVIVLEDAGQNIEQHGGWASLADEEG